MKSEEEKPPSTAFKKLKNLISFKPKSLNEVSEVLQHALNTNIIDKEAQLIAEKAIRLGDTTLKEIMIPKVEMVTVDVNESQDIFINAFSQGHITRFAF
jgi:magnesium and cobalt transporter